MKRVLAGVVGILALVTAGASAASAQTPPDYPPGAAPLVLSSSTVVAGQPFTVTLTQCTLGETVRFDVTGSTDDSPCTGTGGGTSRFVSAPTGGTATGTLTAPTTPGTYQVTGRGLTSGRFASATITVVAAGALPGTGGGAGAGAGAGTGAGTGGLPATGSDTDATLWVATSALVAGLGLTGVAWYRRRRPTAA